MKLNLGKWKVPLGNVSTAAIISVLVIATATPKAAGFAATTTQTLDFANVSPRLCCYNHPEAQCWKLNPQAAGFAATTTWRLDFANANPALLPRPPGPSILQMRAQLCCHNHPDSRFRKREPPGNQLCCHNHLEGLILQLQTQLCCHKGSILQTRTQLCCHDHSGAQFCKPEPPGRWLCSHNHPDA